MNLLLSAFEPFGGATVNASEQVLIRLTDRPEWQERVTSLVLPVVRGKAERLLLDAIAAREAANPLDLVISLGEAGPEPVVRVEMVALNFDDFRIPDNDGNQPRFTPVLEGGPAALFSTAPLRAALDALEGQTRLPVRLSLSAGAFVCNHLYYAVAHALHALQSTLPFVFVHVPNWRPENGTDALDAITDTVAHFVEEVSRLLPEPA